MRQIRLYTRASNIPVPVSDPDTRLARIPECMWVVRAARTTVGGVDCYVELAGDATTERDPIALQRAEVYERAVAGGMVAGVAS